MLAYMWSTALGIIARWKNGCGTLACMVPSLSREMGRVLGGRGGCVARLGSATEMLYLGGICCVRTFWKTYISDTEAVVVIFDRAHTWILQNTFLLHRSGEGGLGEGPIKVEDVQMRLVPSRETKRGERKYHPFPKYLESPKRHNSTSECMRSV
jgi:hypothetical protein